MTMRRSGHLLVSTLALAAALGLATAAGAETRALGASGEVYTVRAGSYASLFPYGTAASADSPVLALEIERADATREKILVPDTEGPEVENYPFALFEASSERVYVVWESRRDGVWSSIELASYGGDGWSEPIEISGDPFSWKSDPQLAVTSDSFQELAANGSAVSHQRRILHLVWWEDAGPGERAVYTPLIIVDGTYIGWNPVFPLTNFVAASPSGVDPSSLTAALVRSPAVAAGADNRSVVLAFVDLEDARLLTMTVRFLPQELSEIADDARAHIVNVGAPLAGDLAALADDARAHIVNVGVHLNPQLIQFLADDARAHIVNVGLQLGGDLAAIADDARAHIVNVGARLLQDGVGGEAGGFEPRLISVRGATSKQAPHLFEITLASDQAAPSTGSGPTRIHLSEDGRHALVAWHWGSQLIYRESLPGGGWSEPFAIQLGETLTLDQAESLLDRRVRGN